MGEFLTIRKVEAAHSYSTVTWSRFHMRASVQAVEKDIEQSALKSGHTQKVGSFHGSVHLVNSGQKKPFEVSSHSERFGKVWNA